MRHPHTTNRGRVEGGTEAPPAQEAPLPAHLPETFPGIYHVRLGHYPRLLVDSGLPAGPGAEAQAVARYREHYGILRAGLEATVELVRE